MGWLLGISFLIFCLICAFNFHVFTAYTFNIDEAYAEFHKWKKHYEQTMHREVIILEVKHCGTHTDFYYKTKKKK